jgi:hypothetical protein
MMICMQKRTKSTVFLPYFAGLAGVADACPFLSVRLELAELVEPWSVGVRELEQAV